MKNLFCFGALLLLALLPFALISWNEETNDCEELSLLHPAVQARARTLKTSVKKLKPNHYKLTAHCEGEPTPLDFYAALHEMYRFAYKMGYLNASLESDLRLTCPLELRFFVFCKGRVK